MVEPSSSLTINGGNMLRFIDCSTNGVDPNIFNSEYLQKFVLSNSLKKQMERTSEFEFMIKNFWTLLNENEQETFLNDYFKENRENSLRIDGLLKGDEDFHLFASKLVLHLVGSGRIALS